MPPLPRSTTAATESKGGKISWLAQGRLGLDPAALAKDVLDDIASLQCVKVSEVSLQAPAALSHLPGLEQYTGVISDVVIQRRGGIDENTTLAEAARGIAEAMVCDTDRVPPRDVTTVVLRNVPAAYDMATLIEALSVGFRGRFDLVHLPADLVGRSNLGVALINFRSSSDCLDFIAEFQSRHVSPASFQGFQANVMLLQQSGVLLGKRRVVGPGAVGGGSGPRPGAWRSRERGRPTRGS